jgi:hypothetical protein
VWDLYLQATAFNCLPSQLLAIEDNYQAYCLNQAVRFFGASLQNRLDEVDGKPEQVKWQRQKILDEVLTPGQQQKQRFKDPGKF